MKKRLPQRYWIGLVLAVLLSLGLFFYVIHQAGILRQDKQLQASGDSIEDKLYDYASGKQFLPGSLAGAGIKKVPEGVTYKKLSFDSYRFCVTYRGSFLGSYRKGANCHTGSVYLTPPPPFVKNADGTYTVCGIKNTNFDQEGYIIPPTYRPPGVIDISNEIFVFTATSQAFDEKCDPLSYGDLKVGDKVDAFGLPTSQDASTPAITIFLKRS